MQEQELAAPPPSRNISGVKLLPLNHVTTDQGWASADKMVNRFEEERKNIVALLREDPNKLAAKLWHVNGLLSYEKQCRCQMMSNVKFGMETEFSCIGCRAISRLTDTNGKVKDFNVEVGICAGMNFHIYNLLVGNPVIKLGDGPNARARQLLTSNQLSRSCCPSLVEAGSNESMHYLESDAFTNFVLASMLWEELGNSYAFPVPHVMTGFICNESGYLVLEHNSPIEQIELKQAGLSTAENAQTSYEIVKAVLCQIILQFYLLKDHEVTLGNPSLARLQVRLAPTQYTVGVQSWNFPVTLFILPSEVTCLQIKQSQNKTIRLFPRSPDNLCGLGRLRLSPHFNVHKRNVDCDIDENNCKQIQTLTYQITDETAQTFTYLRYAGVPLFSNSIDLYLLFLSLMCHKPFFEAIHEQAKLYPLWECLWFPEDITRINAKVKVYHDATLAPNTVQLLDIIRNCECKCAILSELYSKILPLNA